MRSLGPRFSDDLVLVSVDFENSHVHPVCRSADKLRLQPGYAQQPKSADNQTAIHQLSGYFKETRRERDLDCSILFENRADHRPGSGHDARLRHRFKLSTTR
jgi:hypothetical protein